MANSLRLMAPSGSEPPQGLPPIGLDANRDLAEQLLGKTLGPARVIEAKGSRGTRTDGTDVYKLELELEVVPPFPVNLKLLKECPGVVPDPCRRQGGDANAFQAGTFRRLNLLAQSTTVLWLGKLPREADGDGPTDPAVWGSQLSCR